MKTSHLGSFTRAYITTALWSTTDDAGQPLDDNNGLSDISPATLAKMEADCARFREEQSTLLAESGLDDSRAGHCLWLDCNGHGSGFWDEYSQTTCDTYNTEQVIAIGSRDFSKRDALDHTCLCPYHVCQRLSAAAKAFGTFDLYIGDDGHIHGSPL